MATNCALLGLVIGGAVPSISDQRAASKKLVPSLLMFFLIANLDWRKTIINLDWADDDTWWFVLATLYSHHFFSKDIPTPFLLKGHPQLAGGRSLQNHERVDHRVLRGSLRPRLLPLLRPR